ncbi:MAG: MotA/TolQ/ExbB proton channel family protein [Oscillospiraceae bacterium]|nr:MotA/TolQ/ExbB proton channel family protein [Oscillospiraceae bacterium]
MNTATETTFDLGDILRAVAGAMHYPVIILLILLMLAAVALLGWLLAEYFTERRHMKLALPELLEALRHAEDPEACILGSGLLARQKAALAELTRHPDFSPELRQALAIRLLDQEQERYDGILRLSELVARLAPMFGLLGTLIPLGPGILALGQGDTFTLSASLLTAFDTTVAGLLAAAVATVISSLRRAWYRQYVSQLEVLSQCVLDRMQEGTSC